MRLFLFAVLLIGMQNNPEPKNPNGKASNNPPSNGQPAVTEVHAGSPVETATSQNQKQTTSAEVKPFMTHGEYVISAITAIYVIVSFLTFLAVKNTVKVSQLQTKAMVNSQRPWIAVRKKDPPIAGSVEFEAECLVGIPAKIIHNYAHWKAVKKGESLQPVYETEMLQYPFLIAPPDGKKRVFEFGIDSLQANGPMWHDIQNLDQTLYFYGKIQYTDGASIDDGGNPIVHETKWCYVYVGGAIVRGGPEGFNDNT